MNSTEKSVVELKERQKSSESRLEKIEKTLAEFIEGQHKQALDWERRYMEMITAMNTNTDHIGMLMKISFLVLTISMTHAIGAIVNTIGNSNRAETQQTRVK